MISSDLVSVIVPTYNRAWGLRSAMQSVLTQTHRNFELLVVDDCSTDETPKVVGEFDDHRLKYYRQEVNVGMVKNWGEVLRLGVGEFIVFLSDDDQLYPRFLENRLRRMLGADDVIVTFSKYEVRNRDGDLIAIHNDELNSELSCDSYELLRAALSRQWFVGAAMYRRNAVSAVWPSIVNDDLVLDLGLNVRLAVSELGRGIYIPEKDFVVTSHPAQNSNARRAEVYEQASNALERILEREAKPRYVHLIRREFSAWNLVWGRYLASNGRIREARARFLKAAAISPTYFPAWLQLSYTWFWPSRLSARRTPGAGSVNSLKEPH